MDFTMRANESAVGAVNRPLRARRGYGVHHHIQWATSRRGRFTAPTADSSARVGTSYCRMNLSNSMSICPKVERYGCIKINRVRMWTRGEEIGGQLAGVHPGRKVCKLRGYASAAVFPLALA